MDSCSDIGIQLVTDIGIQLVTDINIAILRFFFLLIITYLIVYSDQLLFITVIFVLKVPRIQSIPIIVALQILICVIDEVNLPLGIFIY